ncbi:MAG: transporter substrate-binding protein [Symbiobacteriaceae bacterium]|nr:transporter substrate-binding protein [Symbiobacteriaceae bacterium]
MRLAALVGGSAALGLAGLAGCGQGKETESPSGPTAPAPVAPAPLERLVIRGPQSPATILLAHTATVQKDLASHATIIDFGTVKTADQLRAAIAAKELQVAAAPTNVAANLYRKGVQIQLLNVTVWGTLYVMTTRDDINTWTDLVGKNLLVPLKGDIPDLVFQYLARQAKVDLTPTYLGTPTEAMQMLLAGKADAVVLTEPVATAAQIQGKAKGLTVRVAIDLQKEWGRLTGRPARFPQVGTIILGDLAKTRPELAQTLHNAMKNAAQWMKANPKEAAALGETTLTDLKAPVIEASLTRTPIDVLSAAEAKEELAFFFARLKDMSPEMIGGDLPDADFYSDVK